MAIERAMGPGGDAPVDPLGMDIVVDPPEGENVVVEQTDDGTIYDFSGEDETSREDELQGLGWYDNLAKVMEEGELQTIGRKVIDLFEGDDLSRTDWKKTYIDGLTLLGFKPEQRTDPWMGACGVYHPVMTEAAVRFQSQAIMEIFPSGGPVRTKIVGKWTKEKEAQAKRVENEMNYTVTDKMVEFRPETEALLFFLALAGSGFRKSYYDKRTKRPKSCFVPAEDFVVPYGTTSLESAPRYTQIIRTYLNDIRKDQESGFYREVDIPEQPLGMSNDIQEKKDRLTGESPYIGTGRDERYQILECHIDLDFEDPGGVGRPYIVWVDRYEPIVLAIRRNWKQADQARNRLKHFVAYHYLPGLSFYGSGLIHLIGGITQSATSILRQLVDAGTLNNLPGGLKTRGLRIKGDDTPIMPGEFRDVDVPSGTIRDNITFIPYKEPSQVLHQLLNDIIQEGRRLGAAPDLPINAMTQQAPVGTVLALLERSMKVMSAVQARLHASLKEDYRLIAEIIAEQGEGYEYPVEDEKANRQTDFSQVDIIPVSDPNAASQAYKIIQYQTLLDAVRLDPTGWDLMKIKADFAAIIGIPNADSLLKGDNNIQPMDPVSENMAVLNGKPVKAALWQDHEAHIQVHLSAMRDPKIAQMVGQSPNAGATMAAGMAHITEHLAFQYRREIEKQMGVELPPPDQQLPPEIEVRLSKLVAQAAQRLLRKDIAEQNQQQAQQMQQDPVFQLQMKELQIKEQDIRRKAEEAIQKMRLEVFKVQSKTEIDRERIESSERVAGAALGKDIAESHAEYENDARERAIDVAKELLDLKQRGEELRIQEENNKRQATNAKRKDVH